jgi:hypothetical protein
MWIWHTALGLDARRMIWRAIGGMLFEVDVRCARITLIVG